ncbi:hypothetical protein KKC91_08855 [bacterium]|nr:hypothetical protein [bacterium]
MEIFGAGVIGLNMGEGHIKGYLDNPYTEVKGICDTNKKLLECIKKKSPFTKTFVIELAGGYLGYIATSESFKQGDYESTGSAFKPETGNILRDKALELLNLLYANKNI